MRSPVGVSTVGRWPYWYSLVLCSGVSTKIGKKKILVSTEIRMGLAEIVFRSTDTFEDNPLRYQTRVSDTAKLQ